MPVLTDWTTNNTPTILVTARKKSHYFWKSNLRLSLHLARLRRIFADYATITLRTTLYHTLTRYQQLNKLLTHRLLGLLQNIFLWTIFKKSNHAINLPAQFIRIFATFEICCQQTNGQTRSPTLPCWWKFAGRGSFVVRCWMRYQTDVVWWTFSRTTTDVAKCNRAIGCRGADV